MTTTLSRSALVALATATLGCHGTSSNSAPPPANSVTVSFTDAKGASVGTARLSPDARGVKIALALNGLAPGEHAIHVHQTPQCDAPAFTSAGGHFNPDQKHHGLSNPEGPHAGDMPNFMVDPSGRSSATIVATGVTLGDGPHSVFTGGGTALVIHEKADDMKSDPAGNAGARIACGVIRK
jgi:Cu-Zn family superoxide dismutase